MDLCCGVGSVIARGDFARVYELGRSPPLRELERNVLGCDYGATSWTTREEASRIAPLLGLCTEGRLLDVGAGSGWPGLFLAQLTGCNVVLADLPLVGLRTALDRATEDGLGQRCEAISASGGALPFADGSFDAVSHSDVLCCLPEKMAMLQECRRVARSGATMVFSVIALVSALSESKREIAIASGPPYVDAPSDYALLLSNSGWRLLTRWDVTKEFAQSLRASIDGMNTLAKELVAVLGPEEFAERMGRREATLAATCGGLLKREVFSASADRGESAPPSRAELGALHAGPEGGFL